MGTFSRTGICPQGIGYLDNMELTFLVTEVDQIAYESLVVVVNKISSICNHYFRDKDYGSNLKHYILGVMAVKSKPGYEEWFKVKKPKYVEHKLYKNPHTGEENEIICEFSSEFKLNDEEFDLFLGGNSIERTRLVAHKLLQHISEVKIPKKVKDFDRTRFQSDMASLFLEHGFIEKED